MGVGSHERVLRLAGPVCVGGMLASMAPMDSRIEVVTMRMARMRIVVSTSGSMGS